MRIRDVIEHLTYLEDCFGAEVILTSGGHPVKEIGYLFAPEDVEHPKTVELYQK